MGFKPSDLESAAGSFIDGSVSNLILAYASPDLLIVDDLGLRGLAQDEPADLYEIVRRRYERGSTVITSNRDISE